MRPSDITALRCPIAIACRNVAPRRQKWHQPHPQAMITMPHRLGFARLNAQTQQCQTAISEPQHLCLPLVSFQRTSLLHCQHHHPMLLLQLHQLPHRTLISSSSNNRPLKHVCTAAQCDAPPVCIRPRRQTDRSVRFRALRVHRLSHRPPPIPVSPGTANLRWNPPPLHHRCRPRHPSPRVRQSSAELRHRRAAPRPPPHRPPQVNCHHHRYRRQQTTAARSCWSESMASLRINSPSEVFQQQQQQQQQRCNNNNNNSRKTINRIKGTFMAIANNSNSTKW